ncbi:hypothetical protein ACIA5G_52030 [Amycolatopsis sp. NPDC051758]|uniref:hypothetical protein n=1 Tax=Amycolatopsis sp. NPDC051758 TaxID=3363935 RepID=UPI0037A53CB5
MSGVGDVGCEPAPAESGGHDRLAAAGAGFDARPAEQAGGVGGGLWHGAKVTPQPAATCSRELHQELGLRMTPGDLLIATFTVPLTPKHEGRGRNNYLFDCGVHPAADLSTRMQRAEIVATEWIPQHEALTLLHPGDQHMITLVRDGKHYGEYYARPPRLPHPDQFGRRLPRQEGRRVDS